MKNTRVALAFLLSLSLSACGDSDDGDDVNDDGIDDEAGGFHVSQAVCAEEDPDHEIMITDAGFDPSSMTIDDGDSVRWTNTGSNDHTVTSGAPGSSEGRWFNSGTLDPGSEYCLLFDEPGEVMYFDRHYSAQRGMIVIEN